MRVYYIVFEKHMSANTMAKSWIIRETKNDLDTSKGLQAEIAALDALSGCPVWVINWKRLKA